MTHVAPRPSARLALIAFALLQGCAAIAGLDSLEVKETTDAGSGGQAGQAGVGGTAGTAGSAGKAGTSGNAGTAGTAGSAGKAGTGGNAGTAGTAGTGGAAGSAGSAGSTGTGGAAGSAGTAGTAGSTGTGGVAGAAGTSGCPTGYQCAPPPSNAVGDGMIGWIGSAGSSSSCPSDATIAAYYEQNVLDKAEPATCACACSPPPSPTCVSTVTCFAATACAGSGVSAQQASTGNCQTQSPPGMNPVYTCQATPPSPYFNGTCSATANTSVVAPSSTLQACLTKLSNAVPCAGGGTCAPAAPSIGTGPCLAIPGALSVCPSPYTQQTVLWQSYNDMRSCSTLACGCSDAAGSCSCSDPDCGVRVNSSSSCNAQSTMVPTTNQCVNVVTPQFNWGVELIGYKPNVGCTPSGTAFPTGNVQGSGPITFCCMTTP
ncbi:MAG: hypothetical protein HY898_21345 [Deltaproteobacteria bacterium]|nr:hypothetical protein [Deltaproteobacteria bacterium]